MKPSARRILHFLRSQPGRRAWSWEIVQNCKTADYRKRICELNKLGYEIRSFEQPYQIGDTVIRRHGYELVSEPEEQREMFSDA